MAKAPIFKSEGVVDSSELLVKLQIVVEELETHMKATIPIKRGGHVVGFGVSKVQRGIAADAVISIAKAIKTLKGW